MDRLLLGGPAYSLDKNRPKHGSETEPCKEPDAEPEEQHGELEGTFVNHHAKCLLSTGRPDAMREQAHS